MTEILGGGDGEEGEGENRSPKGNMWSALPVALLCMIVNFNKRRQGSGPEEGQSPVETMGTFVCPSVCPSVCPPQALSGLESVLSGLKSALSGLKSALSGLESEKKDLGPKRTDLRPERADYRPERVDLRPERAWSGQKDKWTNALMKLPLCFAGLYRCPKSWDG